MGIKFHCPNGHRMHVKAFLAGKRGHCPMCGSVVEIPFQSEPERAGGQAAITADGAVDESTDTLVFDVPYLSAAPVSSPGDWSFPPDSAPGEGAEHHVPQAANPQTAPASAKHGDTAGAHPGSQAYAHSPAVWYVRVASGEQFGPLRDEVIRQWIAEGRVAAKMLVWREGWADWQHVDKVFSVKTGVLAPQPDSATKMLSSNDLTEALTGNRAAITAAAAAADSKAAEAATIAGRTPEKRKWTDKEVTTLASLVLLALVIILGTIMLFMLFGQAKQPDEKSTSNVPRARSTVAGSFGDA
jgi:hypothetical protein